MNARILGLAVLFLGVACRLLGQAPGRLDTNYVTVPGTDVAPTMMVPLANGKLLAAGFFSNYGGTGRSGVVRLNANGTIDTTLTVPRPLSISDPLIINGQVLSPGSTNAATLTGIIGRPDGKAVIVGQLTHLGTQKLSTPRIALLNDDGSPATFAAAVEKVGPGSLLNASGNSIYVGGNGTFDSGTRLALVRLNPDGSRDTAFVPPLLSTLGYQSANVLALYPGPGDTVYAACAVAIAFQAQYEIIRLTGTGLPDRAFADNGRANCGSSLGLQFTTTPGGQLVILNNLLSAVIFRGSALPNGVVRLALDGSIDTTFQPPAGLSLTASGAVQSDNKVLLINSALGAVGRLNANGSRDLGYSNPAQVPVSQVAFIPNKLVLAPDGSTYVTATQLNAAFQSIVGVFHVFGDPNSAPQISTQPRAQTNTLGARTRLSITAQGAAPLGYLWFRGTTPINGATQADLVLPTTSASDDADFHCVVTNPLGTTSSDTIHLTLLPPAPGSVYQETDIAAGPNGVVNELTLDPKGGLVAVGPFTAWNSTNRTGIARILPGVQDLDPAFVPSTQTGNNSNPYSEVLALANGQFWVTGQADYTIAGKRYGGLRFNADGSIDGTFKAQSDATALTSGLQTAPAAAGPDGRVVVWASYWSGENVFGSFIRVNADGTRDTSFSLHGTQYGLVGYAITALPDGNYLVGGRINPSVPTSGVVRVTPNGKVDPTWGTGSDNNPVVTVTGDINQILVQPDGKILAAGTFKYRANAASPELYLGLTRLLPNGSPDPDFNPVPQLSQSADFQLGAIRRIALQADGRIVAISIGQNFSGGTFPRSQLLRFWPNGTLDPEFQVATNSTRNNSPYLSSLALRQSDNAIFVAGSFTEFSRFGRTNFARINGGPLRATPAAPTIADQTLRVVAKAGGSATLSVTPGGDGPFQFQWRRNSTQGSTNFVEIPGATNATLVLTALRVQPQDSGLYQCAVVNPGGAAFSRYITVLVEPNPPVPGGWDTSLLAPAFQGILSGQYQLMDVNPDLSIVASLGGSLVRLLEDGTKDPTFNPPSDLVAAGGGIAVVKRQPDGKILVAGRLKDGALARLLPNGAYDPSFTRTNNYTGAFQDVPEELALQSDGKILLAGTFANFAGKPVSGLLRFLPDGQVDSTFPLTGIENVVPGTGTLFGRVMSIRVLSDDRILIGGGFTKVRGANRVGVARLNADGSLDTGFVPPTNGSTSSGVSGSMLFYQMGPATPEGGVYLFGQFRPDLSQAGDTLIRLLADGSIDPSYHVYSNQQINAGVLEPDGKLIVTGQFSQIAGKNFGGFARLNLDGTADTTFVPGSTYGVGVAMLMLPDGKLLAGNRRFFTGSGPAVETPKVTFSLAAGGLTLSWPTGFKLQRIPSLGSTSWTDVKAASPFTVPASLPGEFFRIVPTP